MTLEATPASIPENGGQSTVTASLNTKVAQAVEVTISAAPVGTTASGDFTQIGTVLTIPAGEKASTGTVTISAVDDDVDGPDKNLVVTGTVDVVGMEESGLVWHPYAERLTIRDDDESGLTVSPPALTIGEGDNGTYTVVLNSKPPGNVDVSVSGTAGTDLTVSTPSLTFTPSNWNDAQTVMVTAGQDDDASDDMELLTHTASRTEYGAFALPVTVTDDEGASQRIRLEVEPKQMMENAGPTMVAVKAVLTVGVRQSNTMVMVTVEERDEEYLVSPALFELEIPAGETSVDDEFLLTPIDDDEVEEDLLIGITGVNGPDGIPVDGTAVTLLDDDGDDDGDDDDGDDDDGDDDGDDDDGDDDGDDDDGDDDDGDDDGDDDDGRSGARRRSTRTTTATCGPGIWGWTHGWVRSGWWVPRWRAAAAVETGGWVRRADT